VRRLVVVFVLLLASAPALGAVPYLNDPDWRSFEASAYGTGCDFADVDADGDLDLAVSNGNDMLQAPNYLYLNVGGSLPIHASWVSSDARFSGHCEFADLDADGLPELMVSNYITPNWGLGWVQVYDNTAGALTASPTWESPHTFNSFRSAFGDPDGDGDLDLAVATGEAYNNRLQANLIFFNVGGTLPSSPGWTSADLNAAYDVQFVDIDNDGDQDLAVLEGGYTGKVKIYFNDAGVLATTPGWVSAWRHNGNTFDFDDLDGDGDQDLVVHYNNQLGTSGRAVVYWNDGGVLDDIPGWVSSFDGYGSAIVCADVSGDGRPDLVAGSWWGPVRIYLNQNGSFPAAADWQSSVASESVVENLALADLDEAGARPVTETFPAGSGPHLDLAHRHLQRVTAVSVNGIDLPRTLWCSHLRDGWVSVSSAAPVGEIAVRYVWSPTLDLAVSNWDNATYVFNWQGSTGVPAGAADVAPAIIALGAYPNPFNPATTITFELAAAAAVRLDIYDTRGRLVATPLQEQRASGTHAITWRPEGLASGVYMYRLTAGGDVKTGSVVLAR
jgi:hypothetical protein